MSGNGVPVVAGLAVGIAFVVVFSFLVMPGLSRPANIDNVTIEMERSICFGACPAYMVTIQGDGIVRYNGQDFVEVEGEQTTMIPKDKVQELVDEFYRIGFFSLRDEYTAAVTDLPTTVTSITVDGKTKRVIDYYGAPEKLRELENKIDEIAGTSQWTGG